MQEKSTILHYLENYIMMSLDEIIEGDKTDFLIGEIYAYIECLEIIWESEGIDHKTMLEQEAKYGIR